MKPSLFIPSIVGGCFLLSLSASAQSDTDTNKWVSSAAAGFTLTRGNSETLLATLGIQSAKKWNQNEVSLGLDGAYGKTTDQDTGAESTTAQTLRGFGQYNRLFTDRFYGYGRLELLHDGVADVDYRMTVSPGVGYYFIKNKTADLSGEVGPGYIYEKAGGVHNDYFVLRVAEKFNYKFSDHARLWQSVEILPQVDDFENYIVNAELGVEADLNKTLSLRTFLQDTYDNVPVPGREKNDLKWVTAIAYKF
jgi:putative salt-induced outer membrane protein YdiY